MDDSLESMWKLVDKLRLHPECRCLIIWTDKDTGHIHPDTVDWQAVEDRGTEAGFNAIYLTGNPIVGDCTHCGEPASMVVITEAGEVCVCEDCS